MFVCKLTGDVGEPVDAHIIPKAFYELEPQSEGVSRLIGLGEDLRSKKIPIGVYDRRIVTRKGENIFMPLDDYAIKLLRDQGHQQQECYDQDDLVGWQLDEYDYNKLKLFILSLLWRAHASTHELFQKVDLGSDEDTIKEMILENDAGDPQDYSTLVLRWTGNDFGPVIQSPYMLRKAGINLYKFYSGRYLYFVKVDQRKTPDPFSSIMMKPDAPLQIIAWDLKSSSDWKLMNKMVNRRMSSM